MLRRNGLRIEPFQLLCRLSPLRCPSLWPFPEEFLEFRVVFLTSARAPASPATGALAVLTSTARPHSLVTTNLAIFRAALAHRIHRLDGADARVVRK